MDRRKRNFSITLIKLIFFGEFGAQEKQFCSRYRHLPWVSRQQSKGYRDSQAKVNRRVVYYGLYYGGAETPRIGGSSAVLGGVLTLKL